MWVYILDGSGATAEVTRLLLQQAQLGRVHHVCSELSDLRTTFPPLPPHAPEVPARILFLLDAGLSRELTEYLSEALTTLAKDECPWEWLVLSLVTPGAKNALPADITSLPQWCGELVKPIDTHLVRYIVDTRFQSLQATTSDASSRQTPPSDQRR